MKKILVNGYFGINLGDDLFFKILFDRYPNVKFEFYNNYYMPEYFEKYCYIFKKYNNVNVKKYMNIRNYLYKLNLLDLYNKFQFRKYDSTIFIGGSIFIEENNTGRNGAEKQGIIKYFSKDKTVFILGSNFGPYINENFKNNYKNIFSKCTDVCFRERYSYDIFKDLNNVRRAPDIVFQLKTKNIKKIENSIGISLIELENREDLYKYSDIYIKKIKEIVENGILLGKKITFFSFCEKQGDLQIINKVIKLLDKKYLYNIEIVNYDGNIDDFLDKFGGMENIIGTRFHACILSQVFSQGLYPIIYSDKTYNILQDIGLDKNYKFIKDLDSLDVKQVFYNISNNKITDKKIFRESENQFKVLDRFINNI